MKFEPIEWLITLSSGNEYLLTLTLQRDGEHLYKVHKHGYCLTIEKSWEREPLPSNRTDEFIYRTRFTQEKAITTLLEWQIQNES